MLKKFRRDIFVNVIFARELDRDSHQIQTKHSHPAGAVALLEMGAVGKLRVAIEHTNVVETKKAALKYIFALGVFAVHPPGECDQHFVENRFQKCAVAFSGLFALDLVNTPRRPRQHGWINVVEIPFVGRNLGRAHVPQAAVAVPGLRRATLQRCNDKIVCSKVARQKPAAELRAARRLTTTARAHRRTRPLPRVVSEKSHRSPRTDLSPSPQPSPSGRGRRRSRRVRVKCYLFAITATESKSFHSPEC